MIEETLVRQLRWSRTQRTVETARPVLVLAWYHEVSSLCVLLTPVLTLILHILQLRLILEHHSSLTHEPHPASERNDVSKPVSVSQVGGDWRLGRLKTRDPVTWEQVSVSTPAPVPATGHGQSVHCAAITPDKLSGGSTVVGEVSSVVTRQSCVVVSRVDAAVSPGQLRIYQRLVTNISIIISQTVVRVTGYLRRQRTRDILETCWPVVSIIDKVVVAIRLAEDTEC